MFKTNIINSLIHTFLEVLLSFYALFFKKIAKGVEGRKKSFDKIKTSFSKNDKIEKIATRNPFKIDEDTTAYKALSIMNQKKITSLIVSSKTGKIKGICHIHHLLSHGIK